MATRIVLALLLVAGVAAPLSAGVAPVPHPVPAVLEGYSLAPLAPLGVVTALAFGPDDDLFATTLQGNVLRVDLAWTPAGPVALGVSTFASGFSQPLGLAFDAQGVLYVADSAEGAESGRVDGRVWRVEGADRQVIVDGLPNGRHNANNLRFGPSDACFTPASGDACDLHGRLYVANGNPNDNGVDGGEADVFPYSGALLSVDPAEVAASPAILRWRDAAGAPIAADAIATHPLNADFEAKVHVLAWGFRNVYDVAFAADGTAYTATNGADEPSSQDLLYKIAPGQDYGFPFCYNEGPAGGTGADVTVVPNPVYGDAARCEGVPAATALLGWHVCATGLDLPNGPGFGHAVYVAECGPFFATDTIAQTTDPVELTHSTGHKVVRVDLDADGNAVAVRDFVTGLALPTDVVFGPDGAMYVGDAEMVYRVAPLPLAHATGSPLPPADALVVAGPGALAAGYATPVVPVSPGGAVTFANADAFRHNVVAKGVYGPDDQPWCTAYAPGRCPIMWTPLVSAGGTTPVLGLENLAPGTSTPFYCTLHAAMQGTLVVLDPDA